MTRLFSILCLLLPLFSMGQDVSKLLIARNADSLQVNDSIKIRVMGFTESLTAPTQVPGPLLIFNEGDSIEIDLWNVSQGAPHTIHLHGLDVNQANDGVPALSFEVPHMQHGYYRFRPKDPGTYLYHCHVVSSIHVQAGMYGMLIVQSALGNNETGYGHTFSMDNTLMISEFDIDWHHDSIIKHPHGPNVNQVKIPKYDPEIFNAWVGGAFKEDEIEIWRDSDNILRIANIGNYGNKIYFPNSISTTLITSDGRPIPNETMIDSLVVLPGERFQVLLSSAIVGLDSLRLVYFDLNQRNSSHEKWIRTRTDIFESTDEQRIINNIHVYPNPSSDELLIWGNNEDILEIELLTADGKTVKKFDFAKKPKKLNFDVSNVEPGYYLLKVRLQKDKYSTQSVIISR